MYHRKNKELIKTTSENDLMSFLNIDNHSYQHLEQIFLTILGYRIQIRSKGSFFLFIFRMGWNKLFIHNSSAQNSTLSTRRYLKSSQLLFFNLCTHNRVPKFSNYLFPFRVDATRLLSSSFSSPVVACSI